MDKMSTKKLLKALSGLYSDAKFVVEATGYDECSLDKVEYNENDPEDCFIYDKELEIMKNLEKAVFIYERYLKTSVTKAGYLQYDSSKDRYCLEDIEFHCGDSVEVLITDDFFENKKWVSTRFETDNGEWYLVGYPNQSIVGLEARIRW